MEICWDREKFAMKICKVKLRGIYRIVGQLCKLPGKITETMELKNLKHCVYKRGVLF